MAGICCLKWVLSSGVFDETFGRSTGGDANLTNEAFPVVDYDIILSGPVILECL
jgi:hypothetical protein